MDNFFKFKNDNKNKYFKLFACCLIVDGASRSIICDIQRQNFEFIPNSLSEILKEYEGKLTINEVIEKCGAENEETILEYFQFLTNQEYIFWCEKHEVDLFPKTSSHFQTPSTIDNCIIDINEKSSHDWDKIFPELEQLCCAAIQFRIFTKKDLTFIEAILKKLEKSIIKSIEFILPYDANFEEEKVQQIAHDNRRIFRLTFHGAPQNTSKTFCEGMTHIIYTQEIVHDNSHCGLVSSAFFSVTQEHIYESQSFNNCLNKKIAVDVDGSIKNCPSMLKNYGNIKDTTLKSALEIPDFKKYWNVTKDQIEVCKDCEFRYICTDCRAYTTNPENDLSKPAKCGYSPYTNQWEENNNNILSNKNDDNSQLLKTV